jgi:hypothetical protein
MDPLYNSCWQIVICQYSQFEVTFTKWCEDSNNEKILLILIWEIRMPIMHFANLEIMWFCLPLTQGKFTVYINWIVVESIELFWDRVLQCVWICFGGVKKSLEFTCEANAWFDSTIVVWH